MKYDTSALSIPPGFIGALTQIGVEEVYQTDSWEDLSQPPRDTRPTKQSKGEDDESIHDDLAAKS